RSAGEVLDPRRRFGHGVSLRLNPGDGAQVGGDLRAVGRADNDGQDPAVRIGPPLLGELDLGQRVFARLDRVGTDQEDEKIRSLKAFPGFSAARSKNTLKRSRSSAMASLLAVSPSSLA